MAYAYRLYQVERDLLIETLPEAKEIMDPSDEISVIIDDLLVQLQNMPAIDTWHDWTLERQQADVLLDIGKTFMDLADDNLHEIDKDDPAYYAALERRDIFEGIEQLFCA